MKIKNIFRATLTVFALFVGLAVYSQTAPVMGAKLTDFSRGIELVTPNDAWGINSSTYNVGVNHNTLYDVQVTLNKAWYSVATASDAYTKRKENLKSYIPGAVFIKENEPVTLGGSIAGVSMTYKNPSDLKIIREIMFVHRNQAYELMFKAKEENFPTVKADFGAILQNLKLF